MTAPMSKQFFVAASNGHRNACRGLLDLGVDVNAADDRGATALMKAASMGHTDLCRDLLDRGALIEGQDRDGHVPLHYAASGGDQATCQLMIDRGARWDVQDSQGNLPLDYAGSPEASAYLESLAQQQTLERSTAAAPARYATDEDTFNPNGNGEHLAPASAGIEEPRPRSRMIRL